MIEMLRKKYRLSIEFFGFMRKPKTIHFEYWQATFRDLMTMKEDLKMQDGIDFWLQDFLMKKTIQSDKLTLKLYRQLGTDQRVRIFRFLMDTYGKGFFEPIDPKSKQNPIVPKEKSPSSASICLILEKTSETMESILNMTWQQIDYISEGVAWNLNEQTKEGQKRNIARMRQKELADGAADDEEEQLKELEKRINKKFKK